MGVSKNLVVRCRVLARIFGRWSLGPFSRFPVGLAVSGFYLRIGEVKRFIREQPIQG
jgi:hypothetical protein